jgi:hypothetical protein
MGLPEIVSFSAKTSASYLLLIRPEQDLGEPIDSDDTLLFKRFKFRVSC